MRMLDGRQVVLVGEIEANKWIQANLGNINSLFVDMSNNGFQKRKGVYITEREYAYDVNALLFVKTSVIGENSEVTLFAKRFRCWPHRVTIELTNKSTGSEVEDPNYRFIDGTCRYEEWSLMLKKEVKDQCLFTMGYIIITYVTKHFYF